jgi:hypothetical protein
MPARLTLPGHIYDQLREDSLLRKTFDRIDDCPRSTHMSTVQQYRKKPVVVDAMEWDGTAINATPIIDWVVAGGGTATYRCDTPEPAHCNSPATDANHHISIQTLEGAMKVSAGDYVIRGVQGEHYPCRGDIFAATYELVTDCPHEPTKRPSFIFGKKFEMCRKCGKILD